MNQPFQFLLGAGLAALISILAYKVRSLSRSGALAATLLGAVVFGLGGWQWAAVLIGFFLTSSGLSRVLKSRKAALNEKFSKGSQRDYAQVLANGGAAGLCVLLHLAFPESGLIWAAFAGSLAAANADTWATELGVFSREAPILITTGKTVERGTSGGISLAGMGASLAGSLFIALLALLDPTQTVKDLPFFPISPLLIIMLAGAGGSLMDSFLGATVQAIYHCPTCQKETERHPLHTCGSATQKIRGVEWMNNDAVNFLCTLSGAIISILLVIALK